MFDGDIYLLAYPYLVERVCVIEHRSFFSAFCPLSAFRDHTFVLSIFSAFVGHEHYRAKVLRLLTRGVNGFQLKGGLQEAMLCTAQCRKLC